MRNKRQQRLIYGVGINDADYPTSSRQTVVSGGAKKVVRISKCPYFSAWSDMIRRSSSEAFKRNNPAYADVSVCQEWITFSSFRTWMERQNWQGMDLDKDILSRGSKSYSPETCCFVSRATNRFMVHCPESRGLLLGVDWCEPNKKFRAQINVAGRKRSIGYYESSGEAHLAWCIAKLDLCRKLIISEKIESPVSDALIQRFERFVGNARAKLNPQIQ
ncbi:hypothetical protein ACTUVN_002622 [Pseudomonas caspiana]